MHNSKININHITRVEGHGNIVLNVQEGRIEELRLDIVESPRFFEAMLRGRKFDEAQHITSRICGICAVGHTTASLKATEDALGISLSEQTLKLRKLILNGEIIQSHILHLYFLAAPDFLGLGSVLPLAETRPEVVKRGLRLKKLANDLCALVGGRHIHPISLVPGGFTYFSSLSALREMKKRLEECWTDVEETTHLLQRFKIPDFYRETEYISLKKEEEFALYEGNIFSSDTGETLPADYKGVIKEFSVPHSTAKHTRHNRESFMVGALARINNNYDKLGERAKRTARILGLNPLCSNPFMNNMAQMAEIAHCLEESEEIIDCLLVKGIKKEKPEVKVKAGRGVGAVEVPRGTLYHEYRYNEEGFIEEANCIIPTGQNLANIQKDLEAIVPSLLEKTKKEIALIMEMLVRAYDPCISCSTHLLEVKFV